MSEKDILELVQSDLDSNQPKDYRINVNPNDVRQSGRWWYVGVDSTDEDIEAYEFNQILHKVEHKIEDEHNLHVLLIPALVD